MSPKLWSPITETYGPTRAGLHQIAFFAMSPARYRVAGRMGLRPTQGGFGTPEFGGTVARIEGDLLVLEGPSKVATQSISTIRAATEFFGGPYEAEWFGDFHDPLSPDDPDKALAVVSGDTLFIGEWFEFAFSVLDELRAGGTESDDVSEAQIWPEHFDAAAELGDAGSGRRASYGASPGDGNISSPYIYVAPWSEVDKAEDYWNATSFGGSVLTYDDLAVAKDPHASALEFFQRGYGLLASS